MADGGGLLRKVPRQFRRQSSFHYYRYRLLEGLTKAAYPNDLYEGLLRTQIEPKFAILAF